MADPKVEAMLKRVDELEKRLAEQQAQQKEERERYESEISSLKEFMDGLQVTSPQSASDHFARRVEWTITDFAKKTAKMAKGDSIWSPNFKACGIDGLNLEFFPKGRSNKKKDDKGENAESETAAPEAPAEIEKDDFCSLFMWSKGAVKIKYQLWVGNFCKVPDSDDFNGSIGHGHSNFCPILPEIKDDTLTLGVDFLDVYHEVAFERSNLKLITTSIDQVVSREVAVAQNGDSHNVIWKIQKISEQLKRYPKGTSMWSPFFTAGGVREILMEFYPNGTQTSTKEGYCGFYLRCPAGTVFVVSFMVGSIKRGPIKAIYEGNAGKGLPDFCPIMDQIQPDDSLEIGITVQPDPFKTMVIEDRLPGTGEDDGKTGAT